MKIVNSRIATLDLSGARIGCLEIVESDIEFLDCSGARIARKEIQLSAGHQIRSMAD
jgi:hypothetical protein